MLWADEYPEERLMIEILLNYEYFETDSLLPMSLRRTDKRSRISIT